MAVGFPSLFATMAGAFSLDDNRSGFGLNSMKERAEAEGGRFQLISAPGEGCTLQVWLPWVRS